MILALVIAVALSLVTSTAIASVIARSADRLGLIDLPNERSSHERPTPRGGGIGIVGGWAVGVGFLFTQGLVAARPAIVLVVATAAIAVLGARDDLRSIPARTRLLVQLTIAVAVVSQLGGLGKLPLPAPLDFELGWFGVPFAVLWLATVTNFFNFMDGLDGLATGQAIASCIGIAVAGWASGATNMAIVLAGAGAGFLILNLPPARIFLGDAGSTALGFAIAMIPLLSAPVLRPRALLAVSIGLALFLLDPFATLLRRIRTRDNLGMAHRTHAYQRLSWQVGHRPLVALGIVITGLGLSVMSGLSFNSGGPTWSAVGCGVAAYGVVWLLARRQTWGARASVD